MPRYTDKLWTYQDAVDSVLDTFGLEDRGRDLRQAKEAVLAVNRDISGWGDWQWYMTTHDIVTSAKYETGTIAYTESTRTVTLTGGTWPTDAAFGKVVLPGAAGADRIYRIQERTDATNVIIESNPTPGDDIAAGTSFQWHRTDYEMPSEARKNIDMLDRVNGGASPWSMFYVGQRATEFADRAVYFLISSNPSLPVSYHLTPGWFTIGRNNDYDSGFSIRFPHIPADVREYSITYWRNPRQLRYYKVPLTCTTTSGSPVVQVNEGTVDASLHVGAMVRFSTDTIEPTPHWGGISKENPDNPMAFQATIKSIDLTADPDEITLTEDAPVTIASKAAVLSDPLDIDHDIILSAFLASAEERMAKKQRREDWAKEWFPNFQRELGIAKEMDEDYRRSRGLNLFGQY